MPPYARLLIKHFVIKHFVIKHLTPRGAPTKIA
jgi:hypothetical protein